MNLHKFKKGFRCTNPAKGLYDLPGAIKSERDITDQGNIRVKGQYIPSNTDTLGKFFGILGYTCAWLYVILMPCSVFLSKYTKLISPLGVFIMGMFLIHGFAIFADGMRHKEARWARKGIKIFWLGTVSWCVIGPILYGLI